MSRYEVYDKDADFFRDTQTGAMYLLKCTTYKKGAPDPDILVEHLVQALNDKDNTTWPAAGWMDDEEK